MNVYDLAPHPLGWQVRQRGHGLADGVRSTRDSALVFAQGLARRNRPSAVVVFGPDGAFEREMRFDRVPG